jgi:hypothetical protein
MQSPTNFRFQFDPLAKINFSALVNLNNFQELRYIRSEEGE